MKNLKEHFASTMHNAIGGVLTAVVIAAAIYFKRLSIPAWVVLVLTLPLGFGWFLFFPERQRTRRLNHELEIVKAHRFEDDYKFDAHLGVYRDKPKSAYFCPNCMKKNIISQLKEMEHGWECQVKECAKFYENPDRPRNYLSVSIGEARQPFKPRHFQPRHLNY